MIDPAARFRTRGYAMLPGFLEPALCKALVAELLGNIDRGATALHRKESVLVGGPTTELYASEHASLRSFHWGMTPAVAALADCALVPSYAYLRIYARGDVCRIHGDRKACEYSISTVLGLADDIPWPLDIGIDTVARDARGLAPDFGDAEYESLPMGVGDAVVYRGMDHRHGRLMPNPNRSSIHLFLHWVDPEGPSAAHAFDARMQARLEAMEGG